MKIAGRSLVANLQIKGIYDGLYARIKEMTSNENRSVSQQFLYSSPSSFS